MPQFSQKTEGVWHDYHRHHFSKFLDFSQITFGKKTAKCQIFLQPLVWANSSNGIQNSRVKLFNSSWLFFKMSIFTWLKITLPDLLPILKTFFLTISRSVATLWKFEGEPANYTVEQLEDWFKLRGLIKQEAKRKDLLACLNNCLKHEASLHNEAGVFTLPIKNPTRQRLLPFD